MGKIIGIDLGTTNSCVAVRQGGEVIVIPNAEGNRTTPSVVALSKPGERLVGQIAKRQAVTNPENTIFSVKRFIGRSWDDPKVRKDRELMPYKMVKDKNGHIKVIMGEKEYAPQEISAMVLQKLKADAEKFLGEEVTEAVITVPAYFDDSQRQATKDAGKIAGLDVKRIINEPTASALAYGLDKKGKNSKIAVYDFGGGTFDVSILELGDGVFEVKSTNGDTHLGGDDLDQIIIDWLVTEFKKMEGIDLKTDKMALQRLKEAAEKAKIELSTVTESEISLPFITADSSGPKHLSLKLSRSKLEELTSDLIERSLEPCRKALKDAGLKVADIDEVIMVGGQTRMPLIVKKVEEFFGKKPHQGVNPDEVVAIGAAIQGGVLMGDVKDVLLLDVTPLTLGIETLGGVRTPLIERNTTIPTSKSQIFSTATDNQSSVEIHVLQGEREMAADNKSLGKFILDGIPPAPRGIPQIEVTFDIDANGILHVSAKDKGTGKEQKITIQATTNLSDEEIESMKREAEKFAKEDKEKKERAEIKNHADTLFYSTKKTLSELGDKVPKDKKNIIEEKLKKLEEIKDKDDTEAIKNASDDLTKVMHEISELIYQHVKDKEEQMSGDKEIGEEKTNSEEGEIVEGDVSDDKDKKK